MFYYEENENGRHFKAGSIKELKKIIEKHYITGGCIYRGNILYCIVCVEKRFFQGQKYSNLTYKRA